MMPIEALVYSYRSPSPQELDSRLDVCFARYQARSSGLGKSCRFLNAYAVENAHILEQLDILPGNLIITKVQ